MAMTGMTNMAGRRTVARGALGALLLVLCVGATGEARNWYVKAKANGGNGDKGAPFGSLQDVEAASQPGDTIYVLQSPAADVLDGGIQLKDDQKLIGLGFSVTSSDPGFVRARLTNTSEPATTAISCGWRRTTWCRTSISTTPIARRSSASMPRGQRFAAT